MQHDYAKQFKKQPSTRNEMAFIFLLIVIAIIIIAGLVVSDTRLCADIIGGVCV